jgi:cytoplasmic iron level regulating protein YaaA (DUF328/UPF0246 family)
MVKILLAPSESKSQENNSDSSLSLSFPNLLDIRLKAIKEYIAFTNNNEVLSDCTIEAIKRYNGVAFEALNYFTLSAKEKEYVNQNTIIFSNLFGPIYANDLIPNYVFKQGTKIPNFNIEKFYKDNFTTVLSKELENSLLVDLRAKYYDKYYKIDKNKNYITYKFIKNGKTVSHYAKKYRGILLRNMAINNIQIEQELINMDIKNLELVDTIKEKNKTELIYEVIE